MYQRGDLKEGMTVRSIDGHKLGKVYAVGETEFHIEKGLFFPKDYSVRYAEISDIRDGEVILAHGKESLRDFSDEVPYGTDTIAQREGIGSSPVEHDAARDAAWFNAGERTGVPMGSRPETLTSDDLGRQGIGPFNTGGARASPLLTEEDRERGVGELGMPIPSASVAERPVMHAGPAETPVGTPLRAEEESARARAMTDEDVPVVHDELYDEPRRLEHLGSKSDGETVRKLDLSGEDDKNKRGF